MRFWRRLFRPEPPAPEPLNLPKLDTSVAFPRGLKLRVMDPRFLTEAGRRATTDGILDVDKARELEQLRS